jgi:hypothetical protein
MAGSRPRYGPLLCALGAVVVAIAVYVPWYGMRLTASGVSLAEHSLTRVAQEFGNSNLQSYLGRANARIAGLAEHEFASLSAHQAFKVLDVVILLAAIAACLLALLVLAGVASFDRSRGWLALLGLLAFLCVLFRVIDPPTPAGGYLVLSLREGAWLSLLGSAAILAGAFWPSGERVRRRGASAEGAFADLSGWTPET